MKKLNPLVGAFVLTAATLYGLAFLMPELEANKEIQSKNEISTISSKPQEKKSDIASPLNKEQEKEEIDQMAASDLKRRELGENIDQKTKKLRLIGKEMTEAVVSPHLDQEWYAKKSEAFDRLGKELAEDMKTYQELTWIAMNKVDPYQLENVKEWKMNQTANNGDR